MPYISATRESHLTLARLESLHLRLKLVHTPHGDSASAHALLASQCLTLVFGEPALKRPLERLRIGRRKAWLPAEGEPPVPSAAAGRPLTRGDCAQVVRPCPYVSCRYNLYLDVVGRNVYLAFEGKEPSDMEPSCALDVAEKGALTSSQIAVITGQTKARVQQIEGDALRKIRTAPFVKELLREIPPESETGT